MNFSIAVIDQGIDAAHDRLKNCTIRGFTISKQPQGFSIIEDAFSDDTGHGTGIAAIIHRIVPEIPILAVKLASYDKRITEDVLTEAIAYCLTLPDLRIINISMGIATNHPSSALAGICRQAAEKNILISAAAYNFPNAACFPAHFPYVFGVSTGLVKDKLDYGCRDAPADILAKGTTQRVASAGNTYKIAQGTSFATAHFSGILARLLKEHTAPSYEEVKNTVAGLAKQGIRELYYHRGETPVKIHYRSALELDIQGRRLFTPYERTAFAKKAAVFPASEKEMKTLLEFPGECTLQLTTLIDYPVRLSNASFLEHTGHTIRRDLENIDFSSAFDTLVCGYFLDQLADANIAFGIALLENCIMTDKHLILWDEDVHTLALRIIAEQYPSYHGTIYVARVDRQQYDSIQEYRNLLYVKTPVISVVGTSNRQGKITAQLRIRSILRSAGYKVSHVATEPQGALLGADFIFPYGYKTPIGPEEPEWSRLLRIAMRGIQHYNRPDIILTGTQGGLLPRSRSLSNEHGRDLSSLHFLIGIQPDAILCAVNPTDPPDLIRRTFDVVASYCFSQPLLCFMTPWTRTLPSTADGQSPLLQGTRLDKDMLEEKMRQLEEKLQVPVIDIMDTEKDSLILTTIQDAFSGCAVS